MPLILAVAVAIGSIVIMVVKVNVVVVGSWDDRYADFNGTHVIRTGTMPSTSYRTLYLGYGTAHFQNPVNVYYLGKVLATATGGDSDLGRYLPVKVYIESGSLPKDTYIPWVDPISGTTRMLYFVSGVNRGYLLGVYRHPAFGPTIAIIPLNYREIGPEVYLYPVQTAPIAEACNVASNSGLASTSRYHIFVVQARVYYRCEDSVYVLNANIGWVLVSSGTTVPLYPSPRHYYSVTVNSGPNRVIIYLSYWYAVNADPGFFAVKVG